MQDIEIQHRVIRKFEGEFKQFKAEFEKVTNDLQGLKDLPRIIERQMPMLIHFQICEGLQSVLGDVLPTKVMEFERKKFDEIQDFCMRFRTIPPNITVFAGRIKLLAEQL